MARQIKFGWSLQLFQIVIDIEMDNLRDYSETLETLINLRKNEFDISVDARAAEIDEALRDDFYEYHSTEYGQLTKVFPSLLRSSLFVSSYSRLE